MTVSVPLRVPPTVGVKVKVMVHVVLPATEDPHVLVWAKSPVATMLEMVRAVERLLLRVTTIVALVVPMVVLPKLRLIGASLTGTTPMPAKAIVWGVLLAVSLRTTEPDEAPVVLGEKLMLIVQRAAAFRVLPQVLVSAKLPVAAMLEILKVDVPVLVRTTGELSLV